mmetsp:Transcript_50613/g.161975  ORF Transcript_50613/g.161975 Transcript_50613/m.161975 type:complete len:224 (-) Transcript_50613:946-1617(-)
MTDHSPSSRTTTLIIVASPHRLASAPAAACCSPSPAAHAAAHSSRSPPWEAISNLRRSCVEKTDRHLMAASCRLLSPASHMWMMSSSPPRSSTCTLISSSRERTPIASHALARTSPVCRVCNRAMRGGRPPSCATWLLLSSDRARFPIARAHAARTGSEPSCSSSTRAASADTLKLERSSSLTSESSVTRNAALCTAEGSSPQRTSTTGSSAPAPMMSGRFWG